MKDCDDLVNWIITREDLLDQDTNQVDSTTDTESSPVKRPKLMPKDKGNAHKAAKGPKAKTANARIEAAKDRAMAIFAAKGESDMGIGDSFNEEDSLSDDDPSATAELERKVALQCQQIEELQWMLKRKPCTFYLAKRHCVLHVYNNLAIDLESILIELTSYVERVYITWSARLYSAVV